MTREQAATAIREAFSEGYGSYSTLSSSYWTEEQAWELSLAKDVHDELLNFKPDVHISF